MKLIVSSASATLLLILTLLPSLSMAICKTSKVFASKASRDAAVPLTTTDISGYLDFGSTTRDNIQPSVDQQPFFVFSKTSKLVKAKTKKKGRSTPSNNTIYDLQLLSIPNVDQQIFRFSKTSKTSKTATKPLKAVTLSNYLSMSLSVLEFELEPIFIEPSMMPSTTSTVVPSITTFPSPGPSNAPVTKTPKGPLWYRHL